jgi:hypothetical protein
MLSICARPDSRGGCPDMDLVSGGVRPYTSESGCLNVA